MMQSRAAAARKAAEAQAAAARSAASAAAPPPQPQTPATDGQAPANATTPKAANGSTNGDGDVEMKDVKEEAASSNASNGQGGTPVAPAAPLPKAPPLPLDYVDEIINMLKTAFPLLALMMEKMVDHISIRAKPNSEEDIYRFFAALLNDAMQVSRRSEIFD